MTTTTQPGHPSCDEHGVILPEEALGRLSAPARRALAHAPHGLRVPWSLALQLLALEAGADEASNLPSTSGFPGYLDEVDAEFLSDLLANAPLPPTTSWQLALSERGIAGSPGFRFSATWENARRIPVTPRVSGALVFEDGAPRLMTRGQYEALRALESAGPLGADRQLDLLARARLAARVPPGDRGVRTDRAIGQEAVIEVSRVAPRLVPVGQSYAVRPSAEGVRPVDLEQAFLSTSPESQGRVVLATRDDSGRRQRVVFGDDARAALRDLRAIAPLSPEDAAHALSHPSEVFGDHVDLSDFSERVTGVGPEVRSIRPRCVEHQVGDWWDWDITGPLESLNPLSAAPAPVVSLRDPAVRSAIAKAVALADARGDHYIPAPDGSGFVEIDRSLREALADAEQLARAAEAAGGRLPRPPRMVLRVEENTDDLRFDRALAVAPQAPDRFEGPPFLAPGFALKDHQLTGYAWLHSLGGSSTPAQESWRGAMLADDMGLGKTLQVLSYFARLHESGRRGPHLIVAPVALLANWEAEARRFFGGLLEPIVSLTGADIPQRAADAHVLTGSGLRLVSYETLRARERAFASVSWDTIVLDEAQKVKNPGTQIARVVRTLKARFRIAATGTPVENSLTELWALYDWTVPGLLDSLREFTQRFVHPLRDDESRRSQLATELQARIAPVFLRRLKKTELGAELPPITHRDQRVPLSSDQEALYAAALAARALAGPLPTLTRLFGLSAHPAMAAEGPLPLIEGPLFPKAQALIAILDAVRSTGEKALVFARFRRVQRWLQRELARHYGVPVSVVNGEVTGSLARLAMVDHFQRAPGFGVLVLSPRAAGLGLNIVGANHVVHYTREWNPAVENQATDRVFRIGQRRPVHVHTLTTTSTHGTTVEERLAHLLEAKRRLMEDFVVPMGGFEIRPEELMAG